MKIVSKYWGEERWIELNDRYCYKQILLRRGFRTSLQYHEQKLETNYVLSGEGVVLLEDDDGVMQELDAKPGFFFTVVPGRKHRIMATQDMVLMEVSTPEVDDVIRIEDDQGRPNGRIDSEHEPA